MRTILATLENKAGNGKIIPKWINDKWVMNVLMGLMYFRMRVNDSSCEH